MRRVLRWIAWPSAALVGLVVVLLVPVAYVEAFCRAPADGGSYKPVIDDPEFRRAEANTYLTYPEWHIVYAYEDMAKVLEDRDEYAFSYVSSVTGFWKSFCRLNEMAATHGGADFNTRGMVHTIGVSFTIEMAMKALYEETLGRVFAAFRGAEKTPQDLYSAEMAADYAHFLLQEPWYKYDFENAVDTLWKQPMPDFLRGWERRLALGGEWKAKAGYAGVIADAVKATGEAKRSIRSVVTDTDRTSLERIDGVSVVAEIPQGWIIETPRYRAYTNILQALRQNGAKLAEIAGNDEVMISALEPAGSQPFSHSGAVVVSRMPLSDPQTRRLLISSATSDLFGLFDYLDETGRALEHVYDY